MKKNFNLGVSPLAILRHVGITAPMVMAIAVAATAFTAVQTSKVLRNLPKSESQQLAGKIDKQYLNASEYKVLSERIAILNPSVTVEQNKQNDGITIKSMDTRAYSTWMFALYGLGGIDKGLLWEASELCLNKCPEGAVHRGVVKAYRQKLTFAESMEDPKAPVTAETAPPVAAPQK